MTRDIETFEAETSPPTPPADGSIEPTSVVERIAMTGRPLSVMSKKYDRDGKGYLDEHEQSLRKLEIQDEGGFDFDKIYGIMESLHVHERRNAELFEELKRETRRNGSLRRGIFVLCAFAVLLTIGNIGTSLAAARLAKDTQVSSQNDLMSSASGIRLGTTSKEVTINVNPVSESTRRRHLQANKMLCKNLPDDASCDLQGEIDRASAIALYNQFCPKYSQLGSCQGDGVPKVALNCNGRMVSLWSFGAKYYYLRFRSNISLVQIRATVDDLRWNSFTGHSTNRGGRLFGSPHIRKGLRWRGCCLFVWALNSLRSAIHFGHVLPGCQ